MQISRRRFIHTSVAATAALSSVAEKLWAADEGKPPANPPTIHKAAEFSMVTLPDVDGKKATVLDRFRAIKEAGFEGVEVNSPVGDIPVSEFLEARDKTGLVIHSVMDPTHWQFRLSDPDEAVRKKGLDVLCQSLRDAKALGATCVLLVPGRAADKEKENYQQVWERSQAEIRKAIPVAEETGVKIGVEVVWNNFWTKPEEMAKYLDEINSPWVGAYFDVGNVVIWGTPCAQWVRVLGKRIVKLHIKGYSMKKRWVKIGDGDENWPEVVKALGEIGYDGWATAEVSSKGMEELKDVRGRMDRALAG